MRVIFFGNAADFSRPFLAALVERSIDPADRVELAGVVSPQRFTSPRRAATFRLKRGLERRLGDRLTAVAGGGPWHELHGLARRAGAPIIWPATTADGTVTELAAGADLVLVAGLDRIIGPATIAALPPVFNVHPSLLPHYRGAVPEFWQLADGQTRGGVTVHRIDQGVDTGPVVAQREFAIPRWLDAGGLVATSIAPGLDLMNGLLDAFPDITETPTDGGSYQPPPTDADRSVPLGAPEAVVVDRARAVGWDAPLALHVPADAWRRGEETTAVAVPTATTVTLRVRDPIPFGCAGAAPPGTVITTPSGSLVVACDPGVVLFRTVHQ